MHMSLCHSYLALLLYDSYYINNILFGKLNAIYILVILNFENIKVICKYYNFKIIKIV